MYKEIKSLQLFIKYFTLTFNSSFKCKAQYFITLVLSNKMVNVFFLSGIEEFSGVYNERALLKNRSRCRFLFYQSHLSCFQFCLFLDPEVPNLHVVEPHFFERLKRASDKPLYIETRLVVDPSMVQVYGDEIENYTFTVFNIVSVF